MSHVSDNTSQMETANCLPPVWSFSYVPVQGKSVRWNFMIGKFQCWQWCQFCTTCEIDLWWLFVLIIVMVGVRSIGFLRRAWRNGQRCSGGRRICRRLWNSARLGLQGPRRPSKRSRVKPRRINNNNCPKMRQPSSNSPRRSKARTVAMRTESSVVNRPASSSSTTHPLDEYIFSTLLKRTKHKGNSPRPQHKKNNYVNHAFLSPVYNERCIDTCVAAAAARKSRMPEKQTDDEVLTNLPVEALPVDFTFAPVLPPKPFPRSKHLIGKILRSDANHKPRAMSPISENLYARPRKTKRHQPSTPSSSGVSSGEEGGASSSHNTTRDASSYMDPQDAAEIWQMVGGATSKTQHQGLDVTDGRKIYHVEGDEVAGVSSSVSWRWCPPPLNAHTKKDITITRAHYRPPVPPKKGIVLFSLLLISPPSCLRTYNYHSFCRIRFLRIGPFRSSELIDLFSDV